MKYISVFSGIEAASVAWESLGWTPVVFAEIEPFPCALLAHRFPNVPNLGDVTKQDWSQYRDKCSLVVGGSPCQAFSVAGLRGSMSDHRGNLTLVFVEIVHAINPKFVLWENVPGVLSTKDNAFGCFLAGLVGEGQPLLSGDGSWPDAGMVVGPERTAAWRILDAQYFGLAQRRRRVFVVSCRTSDGINPAAILFEPESVPRDSAPRREPGARVAGTFAARASGGGGFGTDFETDGGLTVGTLSAAVEADSQAPFAGHFIPQVFGGGNTTGALQVAACIGTKNHQDFDVENFVTHSLRGDGFDASEDGTGRGTPLVPISFVTEFSNQNIDEDMTGTLHRRSHAVAIQGTMIDRSDKAGPGGSGFSDGPMVTLTKEDKHGVQCGSAVRRLTPVECERLQGFPDGWTAVPFRGKPASDGPRYKAIGNSMAVTVIQWLGRRIVASIEREPHA